MPRKPISVNQALPAETSGETPALRAHQAVNQPRLAAHLSGDPAGGVGDKGKRQREHQRPEAECAIRNSLPRKSCSAAARGWR